MKQETIEKSAELALLFHNTYERLAPSFGYETRQDTKEFDFKSNNGRLMVAVCSEVIKWQQDKNKFSEEEVKNIVYDFWNHTLEESVYDTNMNLYFEKWFKQFKKK